MTSNPYAPPNAPVGDAPREAVSRNNAVWNACSLIWVSFGISVFTALLNVKDRDPGAGVGGLVVACLIGGAITYWLVSKLKAARNWARWLITVLTLAGDCAIPLFWNVYARIYAGHPLKVMVFSVNVALNIVIIVLLNSSSARTWFAQASRP
jgi:hypothetical protein